jgi:hypothetical protein
MNKIDRIVTKIETHFSFFLQNGFNIVKKETGAMGSWIVFLHSVHYSIRIYSDRNEFFVSVGPRNSSLEWGDSSEYFDLNLLVAFIKKGKISIYMGDLGDEDEQLSKLSKKLLEFHPKIVSLFQDENFIKTKNEISLFWENYINTFSI